MTRPATRRRTVGVGLLATVLLLGACGRAQGMVDTRQALEHAGYRQVEVSLRTAGGIGYAEMRALPGDAPPPEQAARVIWTTLPVRFDTLTIVLDQQTATFTYQGLERQLGPRDHSLDRRQVDEEVVKSGLKLVVALSAAAMVSVGAVVAIGMLALRRARQARRLRSQDAGPTSGLGAGSAAGASDAAEEMPS